MTNWGKYKDEILKYIAIGGFAVVNGELKLCCKTDCADCDVHKAGMGCDLFKLKWLDEEYKEPSPFDDWEIDDKIEVSYDGEEWIRCYFAGVNKDGRPLAWDNGGTSWTTDYKSSWEYARKAEE